MDKTKAGSTPIALRVLKELVLPLAGGVAYGAIVAQAKQMPLDGVTAGGVAFFCILAAQGLVLRTARHARKEQTAAKAVTAPAPETAKLPAPEKEPAKEPETAPLLITGPAPEPVAAPVAEPPTPNPAPAPKPANDFVSIRLGIEELKEQGALPEVLPEKQEDGQKGLFRNLARDPAKRSPVEALAPRQLLDLKMPYQAVLNAAVNFEREVKRRADIPDARSVVLESLFEQPRFNLSKDKLQQLDTLRRVRNNILHGFETLVDPVEAADLVAAFDRAAAWFDPAIDEPAKPAKNDAEKSAKDEPAKSAEEEPEILAKDEPAKKADAETKPTTAPEPTIPSS